ncbi:MAG: hypothetical protein AVDCRST_MAG42-1230 [uncultured Chthoniobacterales bacterium]|uniref:DUF4412 domain-containing protein n=1 Tax=uncultured Chthoniobacterales bacterium TaxID=1836801 RepID=A0A6J4HWH1_9BACT|nr:MAG: hypothetical protein AVDCRST_MAG42-1230 [uncultured Chthoniobacterales bacterium]
MKRLTCSALLVLLALLSYARADLTITQKIEGAGALPEMTMKIKGDKVRIEATPEVTSIFDGKTGEMLNIMSAQKMVMRMSADQAKAAAAMAGGQLPSQAVKTDEKVKVTPTGKKEKINGYDAEEYVAETPKYKASYWVAKDYPQVESIMKQLQATSSQAWNSTGMGMPDFRDFPGLPIRTNVSMDGQNYVTSITAVKLDPLPDAEFTVPQGFQEMKMPNMDALLGGKPEAAATPKASKK